MTLRDPRGLGRWLAVPRAGRRRGAGRDGADVGIELHPWGASEADPLHPDWIVLDLDPGEGVPFTEVVQAAHDVHDQLKALGFAAFPRTTGGKGLHIVVPIAPGADWEQTKAFCPAFAEAMSQEEPHRFLPALSKAERRGRILIDLPAKRARRHRDRLVTQWAADDELLGIIGAAIAAHGNPRVNDLPPTPPMMRFSDPDECQRTLLRHGFQTALVTRIDLVWFGDRPEAVLDVINGGAVRAAMLIEAQAPEDRQRINAAILEAVSTRRASGGYLVRRPALLAQGQKPAA